MRVNTAFFVAMAVPALLLAGCASIIHGSRQNVSFTSEPAEAVVVVDGRERGTTPLTVDLSRKERHTVALSLPGYQTREIALERGVTGWVWGNIVFGGLIGLVVDASTGAMYKIEPAALHAELARRPETVAGDLRLHIRIRKGPPEAGREVGRLRPTMAAAETGL